MKLPKGWEEFTIEELLETEEDIQYFLEAAFEDYDPAHVAHALGIVARARGMTKVAKKTGLTRAALYRALSKDGNPSLDTLLRVMKALNLQVKVV